MQEFSRVSIKILTFDPGFSIGCVVSGKPFNHTEPGSDAFIQNGWYLFLHLELPLMQFFSCGTTDNIQFSVV